MKHIIIRARRISGIDKIVVAFPDAMESRPIWEMCREERVIAFSGDEDDVLSRYYEAAQHVNADWIMRITADCPLVDPDVCAAVLAMAKEEKLQYASNVWPERTYPKGFDCEVFSFDCLDKAHLAADASYDREHVTPWMQKCPHIKKNVLMSSEDLSGLNYCVDYPVDIDRIESLVEGIFVNA